MIPVVSVIAGQKMLKEYNKQLLRSSKKLVVFTTFTSILITISEFICPVLIKYYIDNYHNLDNYLLPLLFVFLTFLSCYAIKVLLNRIKNNYSVTFKTKESQKLLTYMFKMKYLTLNKLEPTYLIEKITYSINSLFSLYAETIAAFILSAFTILGCILLMVFVDPILALIFIAIIPIQIFGYKKLNKKLSDLCMNLQTVCAKSFTNIISITSAVDYIKQSSETDNINNLLGKFIKTIHRENAKVNNFAGFVSITLGNIIGFLNNIVYIYAALGLLLDNISLSDFVFITLINSLFFPALNKVVGANINLRDLKGVYHFIEKEIFDNIETDGTLIIDTINHIDFDIKSVSYGDLELIQSGNFSAHPGDVIMIMGESGCGKTSLVKGLIKFLDIQNIKINGKDITQYSNQSLRSKISFFSQNVPIITGTIKDNILMGNDANEPVLDILKEKPFMQKFYEYKDGLDTVVLENGSNLSGGDKQKISIARVYIENPDVVILDEITSSIDKSTSKLILEDILETYKNKIVFIISHDNSVEEYCNKIVSIVDKKLIIKDIDCNPEKQIV